MLIRTTPDAYQDHRRSTPDAPQDPPRPLSSIHLVSTYYTPPTGIICNIPPRRKTLYPTLCKSTTYDLELILTYHLRFKLPSINRLQLPTRIRQTIIVYKYYIQSKAPLPPRNALFESGKQEGMDRPRAPHNLVLRNCHWPIFKSGGGLTTTCSGGSPSQAPIHTISSIPASRGGGSTARRGGTYSRWGGPPSPSPSHLLLIASDHPPPILYIPWSPTSRLRPLACSLLHLVGRDDCGVILVSACNRERPRSLAGFLGDERSVYLGAPADPPMKATIISQPTPEPPPVTIQITATPLQLAVIAEVLTRFVDWGKLPGKREEWSNLCDTLRGLLPGHAVESMEEAVDRATFTSTFR